MAKHIYIAKQAKGLKFRVTVKDKDVMVRLEHGQFSTDDDELAKEIDKALATSSVGRFCRKADKTAAEALAKRHQDMLSRTGAMKGGVTASALKAAAEIEKQQRDAELQAAAGPDIKGIFDEQENLVLTEAGGDPTIGLPVGEPTPDPEPAVGDTGELETVAVKVAGFKVGK